MATAAKVNVTEGLGNILISRIEQPMSREDEAEVSMSDFMGMIELGVSGDVLKSMIEHIPKDIVMKTVGSDSTNFSKLFKKRLTSKQTDEVNDLSKLWSEMLVFFDNDEADVREWVGEQVPALEGYSPADLMNSFYGRGKVRECLDAMRYGDFA